MIGERVDIEIDGLPDGDIGEVGLLRIGVDPGIVEVDDAEYRRAGGDEAAELDVVDLVATPLIGARSSVLVRLRSASASAALACA